MRSVRARMIPTMPAKRTARAFLSSTRTARTKKFTRGEFATPLASRFAPALFPAEYKGDIFAAFHGRWNRTGRTGYKIVRVPFDHSTGKVLGEYEDFVTGFVIRNGLIWSRPVGITVAKGDAVLFSEDGNGIIWSVAYGEETGPASSVRNRRG